MLAARRHYIPANVPLVKHVAAAAGDEVCALGQEVFINGRLVAERRAVDAGDRPMPSWSGCVRLHGSQLFLLMTDNLRSEEHTSELQSLMRISYAVFCLKKKKIDKIQIYYKQKSDQVTKKHIMIRDRIKKNNKHTL